MSVTLSYDEPIIAISKFNITIILNIVHPNHKIIANGLATSPKAVVSKSPRIILYENITASVKLVVNYSSSSLLPRDSLKNASPKAIIVINITKKKCLMSFTTSTIILIKYPVFLNILKKYKNFNHIKNVIIETKILSRLVGTSTSSLFRRIKIQIM